MFWKVSLVGMPTLGFQTSAVWAPESRNLVVLSAGVATQHLSPVREGAAKACQVGQGLCHGPRRLGSVSGPGCDLATPRHVHATSITSYKAHNTSDMVPAIPCGS